MDGKYLLKRGRTWYVRFAIPYSVQEIFGEQEFVQSLKTKDFQEAKLLKHKYAGLFEDLLESYGDSWGFADEGVMISSE